MTKNIIIWKRDLPLLLNSNVTGSSEFSEGKWIETNVFVAELRLP